MTTFYRKEGRRYYPVSEYHTELLDSYAYGSHLVTIKLNSTSRAYNIDPAFAPLIAAGVFAKDEMAQALTKASEAMPTSTPVTIEQRDAWDKFRETMGEDINRIMYPASATVIEAGLVAMQQEADKMLKHPSVKEAWDHFMLIWELVKLYKEE